MVKEIQANHQFLPELQQRIFSLLILIKDLSFQSNFDSTVNDKFSELAMAYLNETITGHQFFIDVRDAICEACLK